MTYQEMIEFFQKCTKKRQTTVTVRVQPQSQSQQAQQPQPQPTQPPITRVRSPSRRYLEMMDDVQESKLAALSEHKGHAGSDTSPTVTSTPLSVLPTSRFVS